MEDKKILKEVRKAVEAAGGYIEVIHNLRKPDMWDLPGWRKYHAIGAIHLENCQVDKTVFEVISKLNKVESVFLHESKFDQTNLKYLQNVEIYLLDLRNVSLHNEGLAHVGNIKSIVSVWLSENIFTDDGLIHLNNLPNVKDLALEKNKISSQGILKLNRVLFGLNNLAVYETNFCDLALEKMAKKTIELVEIMISGTKVTNEGIKIISNFPKIERLFIGQLEIDDDALEGFWRLENLTKLILSDTYLTDKGVEFLVDNKKIVRLNVSGTKVTDKSIQNLISFPKLKSINIQRTGITKHGYEYLKENLPNAMVIGSDLR